MAYSEVQVILRFETDPPMTSEQVRYLLQHLPAFAHVCEFAILGDLEVKGMDCEWVRQQVIMKQQAKMFETICEGLPSR